VTQAFFGQALNGMSREQLIDEVKRLRAGIRQHRDSSGQDLCWHHPNLWGLLPERVAPEIAIPPWPNFLRGCVNTENPWIVNYRRRL
jgi:hypothetical protein